MPEIKTWEEFNTLIRRMGSEYNIYSISEVGGYISNANEIAYEIAKKEGYTLEEVERKNNKSYQRLMRAVNKVSYEVEIP